MKYPLPVAVALIALVASMAAAVSVKAQGTINQLDQWKSSGSYITQNVANKQIKITGTYTDLAALCLTAGDVLTTTGCAGASGIGDPFTHPAAGQSATTSLMLLYGQASTSQFTATSSTYLATEGGRVGIGTTSPYAKLSVVGPVVAEYVNATSTTATSTFPNASITSFNVGTDYIRDLTGTGLQSVSNALTLNATGDWTGTLDGLEAAAFEQGLTAGDGLTRTANDFDCDTASGSVFGCLSSADWTIFNDSVDPTRQLTVAGTANQINSSAGAQTLAADRTWTLSLPSHVVFPSAYQAAIGTTTNATSTTSHYFPYLATAAGTFTAIDPNGRLIATSTPAGGSGVTLIGPTGQTVDGPTVTIATTTTAFNGLTSNLTVTGATDVLTFAPTLSGTLNNAGLTNSTISGVALGANLADLTATNGTLTFSGNYNGSAARSIGLNLGNANTWTALQQFGNASTSLLSAYGPAYFGGTATSSFSTAGVLTLVTPLAVGSGGTGLSSVTANAIIYGNAGGTAYLATATSSLNLGVAGGGTGLTTCADNRVITGTVAAAFTCEANLTFTGSALTVTGTASITTSATTPIAYGGSAAGSTLTIRSTSGAGIGADAIILGVGNNGAWEAGRITGGGRWGLGTTTPTTRSVLQIASSTANELTLSDPSAPTLNPWYLNARASTFEIGTSSPLTFATATPAFTINVNGKVGSGSVTPQQFVEKSFNYSTTTTWTGTTTIALGPAFTAQTWSAWKCFTDASFVAVVFHDGTNNMNYAVASTTIGTVALSTNAAYTANETRYVSIGTTTTATTKQVSCTVTYEQNN